MERKKNVLIINIHGGFPSCFIQKAFNQLKSLNDLYKRSEFYTRAYPSNASAGPSLHDIIMDAPLGSMIDDVYYDWSHVRRASRSIFDIFKSYGYETSLFGIFGLDKRLNPHENLNDFPGECTKSLKYLGIDEFETQDAFFTSQMGFVQDRHVISKTMTFLKNRDPAIPFFNMINLTGCNDILKYDFKKKTSDEYVVPSLFREKINEWSKDGLLADVKTIEANESRHASTIFADNPRSENETTKIEALKRSTMLFDWLRGNSDHKITNKDCLDIAHELSIFAWKCLIELEKNLAELFKTMKSCDYLGNTIIYITSDRPISLYEHGQIIETPWDACLKSFLLIYKPGQSRNVLHSQPYSLAHLPMRIMHDCNFHVDWHFNIPSDVVLTIGCSPSWLSRCFLHPQINIYDFKTFFVRIILQNCKRLFTVIQWFSITDLLECNDINYQNLSHCDTWIICTRIHTWKNPVYYQNIFDHKYSQVYDIILDPDEQENLANETWCNSENAKSLKRDANNAIEKYGFQNLQIKFPINISDISLENSIFSPIQSHKKLKKKLTSTAIVSNVSCQTENMSLSDLCEKNLGIEYTKHLMSKITKMNSVPLTICVDLSQTKWMNWYIEPLIGTFTYDSLLQIASMNGHVMNIKGQSYSVQKTVNGEVMIEHCILKKKETNILHHQNGSIIIYDVVHNEEKKLPNEKHTDKKKLIKLGSIKKNSMSVLDAQTTDMKTSIETDILRSIHSLDTRIDSPKSEISSNSDKSKKNKSRSEISNSVRRANSFQNSRSKIQPNVTKSSIRDIELGKRRKEDQR